MFSRRKLKILVTFRLREIMQIHFVFPEAISNVTWDQQANVTYPARCWFQWASCHIRKIAGAHAPGMPGSFSPPPRVSDPDKHHGTCVTHVPWCMPASLTSGFLWSRRRGKTFSAFAAHVQPAILRIWSEAHGINTCHQASTAGKTIKYR